MPKSPSNEPEVFNLTNYLSRPVANQVNEAHFKMDEEDIIQDAVVFDEEAAAAEEQQQTQAAPASGTGTESLSPDDIAIIAVNMFDGLQSLGFTFAKKKMTFTADEQALLPELSAGNISQYSPGSKEAIAMAKYKSYLETIKQIPLDKGEKGRLTEATAIYARTVDLKVSPMTGLIMAYSQVLGTRAFLVFGD